MARLSSPAKADGQQQTPAAGPQFLPEIINCKQEDDPLIRDLANRERVALVAFIAPQVTVRVSPVQELSAAIGLLEEFGVEALVNELQAAQVERAFMLVNSPGGAMDSSYKIAIAIRRALKHLTAFVPHVAASGGTLLTVAANEIFMGPMSHITPLDTQLRYKQNWVSATSSMRFFQRATKWFEKKMPEEAPYPQRALTDKLDPYVMEEWNGTIDAMTDYVFEILSLAGYPDQAATKTAQKLVSGYPTHSYVINGEDARGLGLNVRNAAEVPETWEIMRHWLGKYLIEQEMTHCIRYVIPDPASRNGQGKGGVVTKGKAVSKSGRGKSSTQKGGSNGKDAVRTE